MCISHLTEHKYGHAEIAYFNQHCQCALIVGSIIEANKPCASRCASSTPTKPAAQLPITPPDTPFTAEISAFVEGAAEPEQDRDRRQDTDQDETLHAALWGHDRRP